MTDPEPTPPPIGSSVIGKTIQAESYNYGPNVQSTGSVLGYTDAGDYVKYNSLNWDHRRHEADDPLRRPGRWWHDRPPARYVERRKGRHDHHEDDRLLVKLHRGHGRPDQDHRHPQLDFAFKGKSSVANIDWFKFS